MFFAFALVCGLSNNPEAVDGCFKYKYRKLFPDNDVCMSVLPALIPGLGQFLIESGEDLEGLTIEAVACEEYIEEEEA